MEAQLPISIASYFQPRNATNPDPALRNTYYLLEDIYVKGGLQIRNDATERDNINVLNRKAGMLVLTFDTNKVWQLQSDLTSWLEWKPAGSGSGGGVGPRTSVSHQTASLAPGAKEDFEMNVAASCILYGAALTSPGELLIYGLPDRSDTNPYTFVAVVNHLQDDGTYVNGSGIKVDGRRYTTLFNLEEPKVNKLYFTVTNTSDADAVLTVTIFFLPLEN
jgi:hypothetical protein